MDCSPPSSSVHGILQERICVGCLFLLQGNLLNPGIKPESPALVGRFSTTEPPEKPMILDCAVLWLVALSFLTVCHPMECSPPGSSVYGDSPGKNTGVGCHTLLQGIFPTQGSNPCLLHCGQILHRLSHQGSMRILEWVAYPFSRIFPTQESNEVSCTAGDSLPGELPGKPRSWTTRFQNCETINFCCLSHQFVILSFSIPNQCNKKKVFYICQLFVCLPKSLKRYALIYLNLDLLVDREHSSKNLPSLLFNSSSHLVNTTEQC